MDHTQARQFGYSDAFGDRQPVDPVAHPELFEGVLARRCMAFLIDFVIIGAPVIIAAVSILVFGLFTLGLGWLLFWLLYPATVIWALVYHGLCLGGPASATIGMRTMGIEVRTWFGEPAYFLLGAVQAVVFWISVSALTPLILLVGLFNQRRCLLHDFVVGAVVVNSAERAAMLRRAWR